LRMVAMAKPNGRRIQSIVLLASLGLAVLAAVSTSAHHANGNLPARFDAQVSQTVDACVVCHEKRPDDPVKLFKGSIHERTRKTWSSRHGGEGAASEKNIGD